MTLTAEQKKTLFMLVILGVLGLGGGLWYWFMFGASGVAQAEKQTTDNLAEKKTFDVQLQKFEAFKKEVTDPGKYDALKERLNVMQARLPRTEEAFGFFDALDDILRKTNVSNLRLEKEKTNPEIRYTEIPYSVRSVGRYHEFGQFLDLVENSEKRFMRVKTIKLTNDSKRPTMHPIEVEIATYSFASHD
jgi:Tfp pilus assembly protein PilO